MTSEKVTLTKEKETLLITVYAKSEESRLPDTLLHDRFAAEAVSRIDYDFSKLKVGRDDMIGVAMRAHIFDGWTREFLSRHPDATVLHLGCGLDSRIFRIDPPPSVRWFDVDYPEVIALRRRLYPERDGYTLIGSSVTEPNWLNEVPADRPTLIIAEGLLVYLRQDAVLPLLERLTSYFPSGEIAFDVFSRLGVRLGNHHRSIRVTGASLLWSVDDLRELERQIPKLKRVTELMAYDPRQVARMSWMSRLAIRVFAAVPSLGRLCRLVRYQF